MKIKRTIAIKICLCNIALFTALTLSCLTIDLYPLSLFWLWIDAVLILSFKDGLKETKGLDEVDLYLC